MIRNFLIIRLENICSFNYVELYYIYIIVNLDLSFGHNGGNFSGYSLERNDRNSW